MGGIRLGSKLLFCIKQWKYTNLQIFSKNPVWVNKYVSFWIPSLLIEDSKSNTALAKNHLSIDFLRATSFRMFLTAIEFCRKRKNWISCSSSYFLRKNNNITQTKNKLGWQGESAVSRLMVTKHMWRRSLLTPNWGRYTQTKWKKKRKLCLFITLNKTWNHHNTRETKHHSKQWVFPGRSSRRVC